MKNSVITPLSYYNRNNILFIYFVIFLDGGKRKSDQSGGGDTSGEKSGASGAGGFSSMVKKIKGRAAITATGTMMQKLQKDKGKVIIEKSRGEVSLMEQDIIEKVS